MTDEMKEESRYKQTVVSPLPPPLPPPRPPPPPPPPPPALALPPPPPTLGVSTALRSPGTPLYEENTLLDAKL